MDPASAAVAFVGFSASLTTLVGLAINCARTLYDLQRKLREAPEEILRLQHDLHNLQTLLIEIRCRVCENGEASVPQGFRGLWESIFTQIEQDMEGFMDTVSKHSSRSGTPVRKRIQIRIRYVLDENTVEEFRRRISRHMESLSMVQALIVERKLDTLVETNTKFIKKTDASFQHIFSRLRSFDPMNREANDSQKVVSSRIDAHPAEGYRHLVVSTPRTHLGLKSRNQEGTYRTATVYYKYKSYCFCVGQLSVQISKSRSTRTAVGADRAYDKSFEIEFVPPWWMSNTMLRCSLAASQDAAHGRTGPVLSITPISIYQNCGLLKALYRCDISHLKHLFTTNSARPTDTVLDPHFGDSATLIEFGSESLKLLPHRMLISLLFLRMCPSGRACPRTLSEYNTLFQFLLDQGSLPSTQATIVFFSQRWGRGWQGLFGPYVKFHIDNLLIPPGCTLESISIPRQVLHKSLGCEHNEREERSILPAVVTRSGGGLEGIHDCLFRQSEPWLIENFTMSDIRYIAVQTYTDSAFRRAFQAKLHCYRSPFSKLETVTSDNILESFFNIAGIVDEVSSASFAERNYFLNTLIVKGSPSMVALFLNASIDLNEGETRHNYLGYASACGHSSVVDMLIDGGANCARALPRFLEATYLEVSRFDALYSRLLDRMTLTRGMMPGNPEWADVINAMLRNDLAMEIRPDAPKELLEYSQLESQLIHGSPYTYLCHTCVYHAIMYNRPAVLAWLTDRGAKPNDIIPDIFDTDGEHLQCLRLYSWLTMAVELARTACVKVLLESAEDVFDAATSRDVAGRSAIDLAQSFSFAPHGRVSSLGPKANSRDRVQSAADASTLTLLEAAVGVVSGGPPTSDSGLADRKRQQHTGSKSPFLTTLTTASHGFINYISPFVSTGANTRTLRSIMDQFNQLWQMSSLEALLVRLSFLIAYCMLFSYEMICLTTSLTKLHRRSEFRLVVKICVVALICCYLQVLKQDETA